MLSDVEIRPPIPFPVARFESVRTADDVEDWAYAIRLEEELDYDLFNRDVAALRRQRLVGRVRVVALIAIALSIVGVVQIASRIGLGIALLGAWATPVIVLAVVLFVEKVLLRFSR